MRRTKEDAQQTRLRIIDAARRMFAAQGVSRTSLDQIAGAAGVTRGAVYWHFANKTELFFAMRQQVSLPIVDSIDTALDAGAGDPLAGIERFLRGALDAIANDGCTRETFRIIAFKCEYVSELEPELRRTAAGYADLYAKLAKAYRSARREGRLRDDLEPGLAALETCVFMSGLLRLWLLDEKGSLLRRSASKLIAAHVRGQARVQAIGHAVKKRRATQPHTRT